MSALTFKVTRKSGEYIKPALLPSNRSAAPHFSLADGIVIGFFLACLTALIFLLIRI
ncbi:MAG: hypothetical protein M9920_01800 [Verrucomicrobiae bacterium]|nr:hypothetical protein [Verrucomicrobiae bacterium]